MRFDAYYIRSFAATWALLGAFMSAVLYLLYLTGLAGLAAIAAAVAAFFGVYYRWGAILSPGGKRAVAPSASDLKPGRAAKEDDGASEAKARG